MMGMRIHNLTLLDSLNVDDIGHFLSRGVEQSNWSHVLVDMMVDFTSIRFHDIHAKG